MFQILFCFSKHPLQRLHSIKIKSTCHFNNARPPLGNVKLIRPQIKKKVKHSSKNKILFKTGLISKTNVYFRRLINKK